MTNSKHDVIIVGGGHNGLICATYLAKKGRKVLMLEANGCLGGAAATSEFSPEFSVSSCAHWLSQLSPDISKEMALTKHGLIYAARDLKTIALSVTGDHLEISGNIVSGAGLSAKDKKAFKNFHRQTLKFSSLLSKLFKRRPPKLVGNNLTERLTLIKLAINMKLLGKRDMRELMRIALSNIYDLMEENFDNELLKAALSLDGVLGSHMGPRSPNTVFGFIYHHLGEVYGFKGPALVKGGMGALGKALANAAKAEGVEIRTNTKVERIIVDRSIATGVLLGNGQSIHANTIVSNADPKTTFDQLVGFRNIETGTARHVHNIRMKGNTAKLHLALNGLPAFNGVAKEDLGCRLLIAPTMNYIEKAFNHAKYAEYSTDPIMDISIPTVHDQSIAPKGQHVLSAIVQFAPFQLKQGWNSKTKLDFKQLLINRIADYAPSIKDLIVDSELLTPVDLENKFHMTGGHWHHGELSLDQIMMMRPFPGAAQYGTAIDGLFLCGAGSHPGGGVMGLAGRNAANEIINKGKLK